MKKFIPAVILIFLSFPMFSQKPPIKFGDISDEEINMQFYPLDSSAVAVVLADYGYAYINIHTARLVFERHKRIIILKKEGLNWANASIPLYHQGASSESVSNLKGVTYNLVDGELTESKMSKSSVFEEKFNKNIDLHKFALEDVKVGSVIEYSYKVHSEFFFNFPSWQFQETIPVIWSEYRADVPEFFTYEKYMQGYVGLAENDVKKQRTGDYSFDAHRWVAKDIPAFKKEPYMTCENDYLSKINFALSHYKLNGIVYEVMGSWEKLRENLLESSYFGDLVNGSAFLNKTVRDLTLGMTDPKEKVDAIYSYVKSNIAWNGISEYDSYGIKDAFKAGTGSSADINLALASMLKEADLDVDMVILSTRDHGFIREQHSMTKQFNYVLCAVYIDGERRLLDATNRLLPKEILPERCLNGRGLLISKTRPIEWVALESVKKSRTSIDVKMVMDENGEMKGEINFIKNRYDASNMRKAYREKGEEEYLKDFLAGKSWEIISKQFTALDTIAAPVRENYEVEISNHAVMAGDMAYINPFFVGRIEENPFKSLDREYPVDFGSPFDKIYVGQITIPENFEVNYLPPSKAIALPGNAGKFLLNIVNNGKTIFVTKTFSINKSMFVQPEYLNLREFYSQLIAMQTEQIVLKRIN